MAGLELVGVGRFGRPDQLDCQICRDHAATVKRWQDGQMVLRWIAAGMDEARKQFRRVNGHLHLPALRAGLDQTTATTVTPTKEDAA